MNPVGSTGRSAGPQGLQQLPPQKPVQSAEEEQETPQEKAVESAQGEEGATSQSLQLLQDRGQGGVLDTIA